MQKLRLLVLGPSFMVGYFSFRTFEETFQFKSLEYHGWPFLVFHHFFRATTFLSNFSVFPLSFFSFAFWVFSSLIFFLIFSRSSLLLTPKSLRPEPDSKFKRAVPLMDLSVNKVLKESIPESVSHWLTWNVERSIEKIKTRLIIFEVCHFNEMVDETTSLLKYPKRLNIKIFYY